MVSKLYNYTPNELQKLLDESNSYADVLRKIGLIGGSNTHTLKRVISEYDLDTTILFQNREKFMSDLSKKNQQNNPRDMDIYEAFKRETSYKGSSSGLKKKLFKLQLKEKKCECCGITEWNGKPAPLQLHHKDGDNKNNELDNLEILCANCHAQTDTYTGKNIKKKIETIVNIRNNKEKIENNIPIVDEKYFLQLIYQYHNYAKMSEVLGVDIKLIKKWHKYFIDNQGFSVILSDKAPSREVLKTKIRTKSFVQIGKEYNVTDNSVRKWCDAYNLPRKVSDIKSISDEEWETI